MNPDPLDELLGIDATDPIQNLATRLVAADADMLRALVAARRAAGLTHETMAERMGTTHFAVRAFEQVAADPKLSTIRRYALACGVEVTHRTVPDQIPPEASPTPDPHLVDGVPVTRQCGHEWGQEGRCTEPEGPHDWHDNGFRRWPYEMFNPSHHRHCVTYTRQGDQWRAHCGTCPSVSEAGNEDVVEDWADTHQADTMTADLGGGGA